MLNNIINNGVIIVNMNDEKSRQQKLWHEKKSSAKIISEKLRKIRQYSRANRMSMCGQYIVAEKCLDCGHIHVIYTKLCRDRMCPICQWRLSMRRFATMYSIMSDIKRDYPQNDWQFVTLTCQNCEPKELKNTLDEMLRAWNSIASSKLFKLRYIGWSRSVEITYNKVTRQVHPHIHLLLMCKGKSSDKYIISRWQKTCKLHTSWAAQDFQEINMADDKDDVNMSAILETYKYSVKSADVQDMPISIFQAVDSAIRNRRLVSFGGIIKNYARDAKLNDLDEQDDEAGIINECPVCGSKKLAEIVAEWAGSTYIWRRVE